MAGGTISAKTRVEKEVLDEIIDGLNSGKMSLEVARDAARETLMTVDKIEKHEDSILDFYNRLSQKHKDFKILFIKAKSEILSAREVTAYKQALSAVNSGDIATARKIADSAIENSANETTNTK